MPYKISKIRLPRAYDRRVKVTEEHKKEIRELHKSGIAIREIARRFADICSRKTIQLVIFPERKEAIKENYYARGGYKIYYDKDKHKEAIKKTRRYKQSLHLKKII